MQGGGGSMGSRKHGKSGMRNRPKGPRLRLAIKMAAERDERKPRKRTEPMVGSIAELFNPGKGR